MSLTLRATESLSEHGTVEQPRYIVDLCRRDFTARWNVRADDGGARTPAKLDADINVTLPRQWALLQPKERRDEGGRLFVAAHASMNWRNVLAPGLDGVRLLVVTTLLWGWSIKGDEERTQWKYLSLDILHVLRILSHQAGICQVGEPTTTQGEHGPWYGRKSARKGCVGEIAICIADNGHRKKSAKLRASEAH